MENGLKRKYFPVRGNPFKRMSPTLQALQSEPVSWLVPIGTAFTPGVALGSSPSPFARLRAPPVIVSASLPGPCHLSGTSCKRVSFKVTAVLYNYPSPSFMLSSLYLSAFVRGVSGLLTLHSDQLGYF